MINLRLHESKQVLLIFFHRPQHTLTIETQNGTTALGLVLYSRPIK